MDIVRAPPKRASGESFSPLTKDLHGCPVLRRQETTAERHTCELRVLIASIVRAPPKRASGESFSPLTKDLHGCRRSLLNPQQPLNLSVGRTWGTTQLFSRRNILCSTGPRN